MAKYASKVVTQAKAWLGKKESDGSFKVIIDTYNSQKPLPVGYKVKYTDDWCATFVSAVAVKLGYTDIIPTECSCERMIALFKKMGCYIEGNKVIPEAGWVIFYDWQNNGRSDHVGFVEKVSGGQNHVIEGNKGEAVARRYIKTDSKYIMGYGVPKYDKATTTKKSVDAIAKEVIAGKWGSGEERKKKLTAAGYDYTEVQAVVNKLLK